MKKLNLILSSLFFILFFAITTSSSSEFKKIIKGPAIIIDGDTIKIEGKNIRLFGIDAPEIKQTCGKKNSQFYQCGKQSKFALEMYIYLSKVAEYDIYSEVTCYYNNKDRYGRILGICYVSKLNGERIELNKIMVLSGNAVAYLKYSKKYLKDQEIAKSKNRILWRREFDMPWEWRKKNK
tara:strand:+ start:233 stop:772 length:540 start_codon:yes stop_codon:yes gene_type:complete